MTKEAKLIDLTQESIVSCSKCKWAFYSPPSGASSPALIESLETILQARFDEHNLKHHGKAKMKVQIFPG